MSDSSVTDLLKKPSSRRRFLREGGLLAVAVGAACKAGPKAAAAATRSPAGQTGGTMGPHDTPSGATATKEGDRVRVILHNQLPESTAIHFHGLELPNDMDGVPFITPPPVKPGAPFTHEFVVPNAGSHMYPLVAKLGQKLRIRFMNEGMMIHPMHLHGST